MAQTFLQIAQYISLMPNSELSTVNSITDVTDEEKNAINRALLQVWNDTNNWDFRFAKTTFDTVVGQSDYDFPTGASYIKENGLRVAGNSSPLRYEPNHEAISTYTSGTPYRYWIEGDAIVLDPIPNSVKTVTAKYRTKNPVKTATDVEQVKLINATDVLNIPARVECEFIDCLGHMTNLMLNADQTDEDYAEHNLRYKNALAILKQVDRGAVDNFSSITF